MGCGEVKNNSIPELNGTYENGNEEQKQYLNKLVSLFKNPKSVNYKFRPNQEGDFNINIIINGVKTILEDKFIGSEECMAETLDKAYNALAYT